MTILKDRSGALRSGNLVRVEVTIDLQSDALTARKACAQRERITVGVAARVVNLGGERGNVARGGRDLILEGWPRSHLGLDRADRALLRGGWPCAGAPVRFRPAEVYFWRRTHVHRVVPILVSEVRAYLHHGLFHRRAADPVYCSRHTCSPPRHVAHVTSASISTQVTGAMEAE